MFTLFQIIPLKRESLLSPSAKADIAAATDFYRFLLTSDNVNFKRPLTVKLPLPLPVWPDDDHVTVSADTVVVCQLVTSSAQDGGEWAVVDGPLRLTRNSVAFETRSLTK